MDINQINLKKAATQKLRDQLVRNDIARPSKMDRDTLMDKAGTAIKNKDYMTGINGLTIGAFFEPDKTFDYIAKKGLFRYYQETKGKCLIPSLAADLRKSCEQVGALTNERATYIDSVIELGPFHKFYHCCPDKSGFKNL